VARCLNSKNPANRQFASELVDGRTNANRSEAQALVRCLVRRASLSRQSRIAGALTWR
jgi:hypothetical protein